MSYIKILNNKFTQKFFPRFSEMQYFILIASVALLFVFSPIVKSETTLFIKGIPFESLTLATALVAFFIWAVQIFILIILPILLAITMITGKRFDDKTKQIVCTFYYSLYGMLALLSINDQYKQYGGETGMFKKINVLITLIVFVVIFVRWFGMILLLELKNPKIDSYFAVRFKDIQYHWIDFCFILISSIAIMWFLGIHYTHPASLVFLTVSYSLVVLKIFDVIFHKRVMPILK